MLKSTVTPEIVANNLSIATTQLQSYCQSVDTCNLTDLKLMNEYMKWVKRKTELLGVEKNFKIPSGAAPSKISKYTYDWLNSDKQAIIDKYYKLEDLSKEYIVSVKKSDIAYTDLETIVTTLVLKRGNVVWVEFGYNIGCEFGGRHPALILRNSGESLCVLPISSQTPNSELETIVKIDQIYGFEPIPRWTNISRMQYVSRLRVDLLARKGSVKGSLLSKIRDTIELHGVK